jgi:hypothetical protein
VYAFKVVLDEDAAEFLVFIIDVVWPLDANVFGVLAQHIAEGYGDEFAEGELLGCSDAMSGKQECEEEIPFNFRLPRIASLASSCSLIISGDESNATISG